MNALHHSMTYYFTMLKKVRQNSPYTEPQRKLMGSILNPSVVVIGSVVFV